MSIPCGSRMSAPNIPFIAVGQSSSPTRPDSSLNGKCAVVSANSNVVFMGQYWRNIRALTIRGRDSASASLRLPPGETFDFPYQRLRYRAGWPWPCSWCSAAEPRYWPARRAERSNKGKSGRCGSAGHSLPKEARKGALCGSRVRQSLAPYGWHATGFPHIRSCPRCSPTSC